MCLSSSPMISLKKKSKHGILHHTRSLSMHFPTKHTEKCGRRLDRPSACFAFVLTGPLVGAQRSDDTLTDSTMESQFHRDREREVAVSPSHVCFTCATTKTLGVGGTVLFGGCYSIRIQGAALCELERQRIF